MSKLFKFTLILVCFACIMSCDDDDQYQIDGNWPPLEIVDPNQSVSKNGGEAVFEVTNYKYWFIDHIVIQQGDQSSEIIPIKYGNDNHIDTEWFTITIPDNERNKLYCTVKKNNTDDQRTITISVSVGDAFSTLTVTQE